MMLVELLYNFGRTVGPMIGPVIRGASLLV
jgi:hypothetical protein